MISLILSFIMLVNPIWYTRRCHSNYHHVASHQSVAPSIPLSSHLSIHPSTLLYISYLLYIHYFIIVIASIITNYRYILVAFGDVIKYDSIATRCHPSIPFHSLHRHFISYVCCLSLLTLSSFMISYPYPFIHCIYHTVGPSLT
jgi:hypothetical protein